MLSDLPCQSKEKMRNRIFRGYKLLATTWIACLLVGIGGCSVLPGHGRPGGSETCPTGTSIPDTAGSWKLTDLETKDGRFLALAIAGGGSRAANFGAAVMLELERRGLLEQVEVSSG